MIDEEYEALCLRHKKQWALLGIEAHYPNCLCVSCREGPRVTYHPGDCGCIHCTGWFYKRSLSHPFFGLIDRITTLKNEIEAKDIKAKIQSEKIVVLQGHLAQNPQLLDKERIE